MIVFPNSKCQPVMLVMLCRVLFCRWTKKIELERNSCDRVGSGAVVQFK
jgi:hypothetical protein